MDNLIIVFLPLPDQMYIIWVDSFYNFAYINWCGTRSKADFNGQTFDSKRKTRKLGLEKF